MEETYIFPVLLKANRHVELVNELIKQHNLGRELTNKIMIFSEHDDMIKIIEPMKLFINMYRYHETREDTPNGGFLVCIATG
jgi:hypothetical protein